MVELVYLWFGKIYLWFDALFGGDLAVYLAGGVCQETNIALSGPYQLTPIVIVMLIVGVINRFNGFFLTTSLLTNVSGNCLSISNTDCWMFGLANFFVSAMFFIVFFVPSFVLKWWRSSFQHYPYNSNKTDSNGYT
jgi:hypothetical protein